MGTLSIEQQTEKESRARKSPCPNSSEDGAVVSDELEPRSQVSSYTALCVVYSKREIPTAGTPSADA